VSAVATKRRAPSKPVAKEPASADGLAMALLEALSAYRRSHAAMTEDDVRAAVEKLTVIVEED
jgi:hypothetical protein